MKSFFVEELFAAQINLNIIEQTVLYQTVLMPLLVFSFYLLLLKMFTVLFFLFVYIDTADRTGTLGPRVPIHL